MNNPKKIRLLIDSVELDEGVTYEPVDLDELYNQLVSRKHIDDNTRIISSDLLGFIVQQSYGSTGFLIKQSNNYYITFSVHQQLSINTRVVGYYLLQCLNQSLSKINSNKYIDEETFKGDIFSDLKFSNLYMIDGKSILINIEDRVAEYTVL